MPGFPKILKIHFLPIDMFTDSPARRPFAKGFHKSFARAIRKSHPQELCQPRTRLKQRLGVPLIMIPQLSAYNLCNYFDLAQLLAANASLPVRRCNQYKV